jgi:hypothetical protein
MDDVRRHLSRAQAALLTEEFESLGVKRGGLLLLNAAAARHLIQEAERRGLRILGMDGFRLTADGAESQADHILDLSTAPGGWQEALAFVAERSDLGLVFDIVVGENRNGHAV